MIVSSPVAPLTAAVTSTFETVPPIDPLIRSSVNVLLPAPPSTLPVRSALMKNSSSPVPPVRFSILVNPSTPPPRPVPVRRFVCPGPSNRLPAFGFEITNTSPLLEPIRTSLSSPPSRTPARKPVEVNVNVSSPRRLLSASTSTKLVVVVAIVATPEFVPSIRNWSLAVVPMSRSPAPVPPSNVA